MRKIAIFFLILVIITGCEPNIINQKSNDSKIRTPTFSVANPTIQPLRSTHTPSVIPLSTVSGKQVETVATPSTEQYLIYSAFDDDGTFVSIRKVGLDGQVLGIVAEHVGSIISFVPDGNALVYMEYESGTVHVKDLEVGQVLDVRTPNRSCDGVSLSPDRKMLALSCNDIFVKQLDSEKWIKLTIWIQGNKNQGVFFTNPAWSPDGKWLAYGSPAGSFAENPAGGLYMTDLSCLVDVNTCQEATNHISASFWAYSYPAWSPDSDFLAFKFGEAGAINIWDKSMADRRILEIPERFEKVGISGIAWSPEGDRLAFSYMNDIYIVRIDGKDLTLVGKNLGFVKAWVDIRD